MGNAQSSAETPVRRPTQKLSKMRTGSHAAPAGLLNSDNCSSFNALRRLSSLRLGNSQIFVGSSIDLAELSTHLRTGGADAALARLEGESVTPELALEEGEGSMTWTKESRRRSLFRSKSSRSQSRAVSRRRDSLTNAVPNVPPPRANSMKYDSAVAVYGPPFELPPPPPLPRVESVGSCNYDLSTYAAKRLHNVAEEPYGFDRNTVVSESKMAAVPEAETALEITGPVRQAIPHTSTDLSMYTLVRRRSIVQTPGIATRAPFTYRERSFNPATHQHSRPPTPVMSRSTSVDNEHCSSMLLIPQAPDFLSQVTPRVITPCEAEYQSIGAFRLGTLRITNGAASPISPESEMNVKAGAYETVSKHDLLGVERKDSYSGSPLGKPDHGGAMLSQPGATSHHAALTLELAAPKPRSARVNSSLLERPRGAHFSEPTTLEVPQNFLGDIRFSPFSLAKSRTPSPALQTTSKHTANEDDLFNDNESVSSEYLSKEVLDIRVDPNAKSQPGALKPACEGRGARIDSGFMSTNSLTSEFEYQPLAKADSGYSSNMSLRSFNGGAKPQAMENDHSPEQDLSPTSVKKSAMKKYENFPAVLSTKRDADVAVAVIQDSGFATHRHTQRRPSLALIDGARSNGLAINSPKSASSPRTPVSAKLGHSLSAFSIGSGTQRASKLQRLLSAGSSRRRPSISGGRPLTVDATHEPAAIPAIPLDAKSKPREHSGKFPMTKKQLALKTRASKEALRTIMSVGSLEAGRDALNMLPVDNRQEPLRGLGEGRRSFQSVEKPVALPLGLSRQHTISRKSVPSRQSSVKERENENEDIDETCLVQSVKVGLSTLKYFDSALGSSPYDVATRTAPKPLNVAWTRCSARAPGPASDGMSHSLPPPMMSPTLFARTLAPHRSTASAVLDPRLTQDLAASIQTPAPLRTRSSTGTSHESGKPLSRPSSHDSIRSSHLQQQTQAIQQNASSRSYDTPPPIPMRNPRRSMTIQVAQGVNHHDQSHPQFKYPNFSIRTGHHLPPYQGAWNTADGLHSSLPATYQPPPMSQRSNSAQPYQGRRPSRSGEGQGQSRHRSTYEGRSNSLTRSKLDYGSPSPGIRAAIDQEWRGLSRYPQPIMRGGVQAQSYGGNPPYRVLHSYNSPAYRGVPIWG